MDGKDLKKRLVESGYKMSALAELLHTSQQNLDGKLSKNDIKVGLLEQLAEATGKPITWFFGDTEATINDGGVSKALDILNHQLREKDEQIRRKDEQLSGLIAAITK